jgi:hypothetical protein
LNVLVAVADLGLAALLLKQHLAFGFDQSRVEQGGVRHLRKQIEAEVEARAVGAGKVELVDGLGGAGRCVGVASEARSQFLPGAPSLPVGELGCAAKGHMLDEMGPALLLVLLVKRSGVDPKADRDLARRKRILPNRIAKPVWKRPNFQAGSGAMSLPR